MCVCVFQVLSDVLLTDGQGEPLQQALDYAAIDMVKVGNPFRPLASLDRARA